MRSLFSLPALSVAVSLLFTACFTGIEGTPPITDREVRRATPPPNPDDTYLSDIRATPVADLRSGSQWIVNDSRINRIFGAGAYDKQFQPGDTLTLQSVRPTGTLDGRSVGEVVFTDAKADTLIYRTSRIYEDFIADTALSLPFAVEAAIIDAVGRLMVGQKYYLLTASRIDTADVVSTGRKYVPVVVEKVSYGNSYYPVSLALRDDLGVPFKLYMSVDGNSVMPRKFSSLLSLTDPRTQYPDISDDVWAQIVGGKVKAGMTANECRLSIGRPADIVRQAGYSSLIEIWTYPNGYRLVFTDGILTDVL